MTKNNEILPIILAGGFGTRLSSVIKDRPKVLAIVNNQPFIYYILDQLLKDGFSTVVLSIGYMGQMIEEAIGISYKSLKIEYVREEIPLGTGGAIKNIANLTNKKYLMVINGDTYHNISRKIFNKKIRKNCNHILCIYKKYPKRYGLIKLGKNNIIESIKEKSNSETYGLINIGTYIIKRKSILHFNLKIFSMEKDFFPYLIKLKQLYAVISKGKFIDIGVPEDYFRASEYIDRK